MKQRFGRTTFAEAVKCRPGHRFAVCVPHKKLKVRAPKLTQNRVRVSAGVSRRWGTANGDPLRRFTRPKGMLHSGFANGQR